MKMPLSEKDQKTYNAFTNLANAVFDVRNKMFADPVIIPAPPAPMNFGMNLAGTADSSTEWVFTDAMKVSRPWYSQIEGLAYDEGMKTPLTLDPVSGYPQLLKDKQFAETFAFFFSHKGHCPSGLYKLSWDGNGAVQLFGAANQTANVGPVDVNVSPDGGFLAVRIIKTDPTNPVRNIRLVNTAYNLVTFYPQTVARYKPFKVLRFMDWLWTSNSKLSKWADRTTINSPTQGSSNGASYEYCLAFADAVGAAPWLTVPHLADDDFVRQLGNLLRGRATPVYVEYSNECWNMMFDEAKYCRDQGIKNLTMSDPYEAQIRWYGKRSSEIFKILKNALGRENVIGVLSTHHVDPRTGQWALGNYGDASAIAVAPYFGHELNDTARSNEILGMTDDQRFSLLQKSVTDNKARTQAYADLAKKYGVKLFAYEGGPHLVRADSAALTDIFTAMNRSPKMRDVMIQDYKNWQEVGGDLFCVFSSVSKYTQFGSWGTWEFADTPIDDSPKWQAVKAMLGTANAKA
jgi:hypothetical protein